MALTKFGPYTPDKPDYENEGLTECLNVKPGSGGYRPFPQQTVVSTNALSATCMGAFSFIDDNNVSKGYVGTNTQLYILNGLTHSDASRSGEYAMFTEDHWHFTKFNDYVIATNGTDPMQQLQIGDTQFSDITAAPRARHIGLVKNFLVAGSIVDNRSRVHWSAASDPFTWPTPGSITADAVQSGRHDFNNLGGPVQAVIGGDIGFVFQENAISRMSYVGGSVVFQFDSITNLHGLMCANGYAKVGNLVYFLARDGFYVFDGSQAQPIGQDQIDQFFLSDLNFSHLHRIQCATDPRDNVVIWSYPNGSSAGVPNRQVIYNYVTGQWSRSDFTDTCMFTAFGRGLSLDDMDSEVTATLEEVPLPLDSYVYNRGRPVLSGYNTSHQLVDYTGTAATAVMDVAEIMVDGRRSYIRGVRPAIEASSTMVQIGTRNLQTETETYGSSATVQANGVANFRVEGRYHRIRFTIHDLTLANGYEVDIVPSGVN